MSSPDFFVAGGTLHPDCRSYVERAADDELLHLALAGEFCYVLTARQMGKSSLMVRTDSRLKERGVSTAIIDLTKLGTVVIDQWYLGLLTRLKAELKLSIDPEAWWKGNASVGRVQRFTDFLREVILAEIKTQIVIFIDEIDTTLKLDFTDDFFAAIRAVYNARADDPEFNRLTFVLVGVATPTDLIKDPTRTPFNIGQGIALQEFSETDASVLQAGLEAVHPSQGETIFTRIYHWTHGHPYLTQKLCVAAVETEVDKWSIQQVDGLVKRLFLSEVARKESNLQFVQDGIQNDPHRRQLLTIYRQVYQDKAVPDDERSLEKSHLKLFGLVKSEGGILKIRNEIYRQAFNLDWIKANTPVDWTRRVAIISTLLVLLLAGIVGFSIYRQGQQITEARAQAFVDSFRNTTSAEVRITSLAELFNLPGYEDQAQRLFYEELRPEEQLNSFDLVNPQAVGAQLVTVVKGLYIYLEDDEHTSALLEAMALPLRDLENTIAVNLAVEIEQWRQGRIYYSQGEHQQAITAYSVAISLNQSNPGTHFDRALAYAALEQYQEALVDFDKTAQLAKDRVPAVEDAIISNSALYIEWIVERERYPALIAFVPTPTPSATPTFTPTVTKTPTPTLGPTSSPTPISTPTLVDTPSTAPTWTPLSTLSPSPTPTRAVSRAFTPTSAPNSIPAEFVGKIAFLSDRDGVERVYIMNPDSTNQIPLEDRRVYDTAIVRDTYSSDGRYRAYNERFSWGRRELQVVAWDNKYQVQIPVTQFGSGIAYDPAWSPVTYKLALVSTESGNEEIWTINLDGTKAVQLTRNTWEWDKHPSWSPDGSHIVFFSNRTRNRDIWVMNADGSDQRNLTNTSSEEWDPVWIKY